MFESTMSELAGHVVVLSLLAMTLILTAIFMTHDGATAQDDEEL